MIVIVDSILVGLSREKTNFIQKKIIQHFEQLPRKEREYLLERFYKADNCKLITMKKGYSIRLYFQCQGVQSVVALRRIIDSGRLHQLLESFFYTLLYDHFFYPFWNVFNVMFLHLVDYWKCVDYFDQGKTVFLKTVL